MTAWRRQDGVLSDVVDGRAVLIGRGGQEVITLNQVGSLVWEWMDTPRTDQDLAAMLAQRFSGLSETTAGKDVGAFLAELVAAGLVVETP